MSHCEKFIPNKISRRRAMQAAGVALMLAFGVLTGCRENASEQSTGAAQAVREAPLQATSSRKGKPTAKTPDSSAIPPGMVYVPGGATRIGITAATWKKVKKMHRPGIRKPFGRNALPSFKTEVDPFFLQKHPVTVAQFRRFVQEAHYTTQAEKFGNGGVMRRGRWKLVNGATWRHPRGPDQAASQEDHPVTQVSYNDAAAYCKWADRRLPTEIEWEHAARGGDNDRSFCPTGACPHNGDSSSVANTWQGRFPINNTVADGYRYTSPVGTFGETDLGLTDMSGNVWEWTSSWYKPYPGRKRPFKTPRQRQKVQRGGSFQCNECGGYRVFSRSHATPQTSLFHVGFRCAKDAPRR